MVLIHFLIININAVYYPSNTSVTVYFTQLLNNSITDYQYSLDGGTTFNSMGTIISPYTINNIASTSQILMIRPVLGNLVGSPSKPFTINPSLTPKATYTNCTILYTSTYEYYVFTNTSASSTLSFSNTTNIEYLVVGAGGNGGPCNNGGGGGAGGVLNTTATISSGTTLTINVGNYATYNNTQATRGGNSTISGTGITNGTAYGGGSGAAAWNYAFAANTGGSGGGGGSYGYATGGAATTGSGYNGTSGGTATGGNGTGFGSGGGGGAGGNGKDGKTILPTGVGGAGGDGTSAYSDWVVTIAGYMNTVITDWSNYTVSNGIGYIASGGSGGTGSEQAVITGFTARTIGGGGSGGPRAYANINNTPLPTVGIPNTGGGGGGFGSGFPGYYQYFQNVGGSGIVIVRTLI